MRSPRKAIALFVCVGLYFALQLSGCSGSSGSTTGSTPPSTASISANPTSITAGQSSALTITTGAATSCTGTGTLAGTTVPLNSTGTVTVTPTATSTYGVSCTGPGGSSTPASATVTVTAAAATVTSVTVTATPTAITTAQTVQVVAVVAGTGSFSSAVTWTATGGTISGTGNTVTLTPSGAGTAIATATSTQTGYTTVSGSADVAVTRAAPVITSATIQGLNWMFCPGSCNKGIIGFVFTGTGFEAGDQISFSGYWPTATLTAAEINADGTWAQVGGAGTAGGLVIGATQSSNFIYFTDVPTDGTPASNTIAFAYLPGYNTTTHGPNGELINQSSGTAYLWQNAGGTPTNVLSFYPGAPNVVYETDGTNAYFIDGYNTYALDGTLLYSASDKDDGWISSGTAAENGTACLPHIGGNDTSVYKVGVPNGQSNAVPTGTLPYACVMGTFGGTTHEYVASVDGTPTLFMLDTVGTIVDSKPLTGITSRSGIVTANVIAGGWQMAIFHSGTNEGKLAVLSTYDKKLFVYDGTQSSLSLLNTISLPCALPSEIDAVDATGKFVVSCIKVAGFYDSGTTFLSIDPVAGTATPLAAFSKVFANGFAADAVNLYIFQGSGAPDIQPNK